MKTNNFLLTPTVGLFTAAGEQQSWAQGLGTLSGENGSLFSTVLLSAACLVVTILAIVLLKGLGKTRRNGLSGQTGLDLMELKRKGLLTPEEMEKVSRSIRRQMDLEQASKQKIAATPPPEALLHDPEVRRLEVLAQAARQADEQARAKAAATEANPESEIADEKPEAITGASVDSGGETDFAGVELPSEVQQLADAGVLTPEEINNVKRRLWERQRPGN